MTVLDKTPPSLILPTLAPITATGPGGAAVTYAATAADAAPASPVVSCIPASASIFPVGTTTVVCSATDAAGNTGQGQFSVSVASSPVSTAARDITSRLAFSPTGFTLNRTTNRWSQKVTIRNAGATPIVGPISLVLNGLTSGVTLYRATGVTQVFYPASPFKTLAIASLPPGAATTVTLEFTKTGSVGISYIQKALPAQARGNHR